MTEIVEKKFNIIGAKELLNSDLPEPAWLVENIISEEGVVFFAGEPSAFKSFIALFLAILTTIKSDSLFLNKFKTKSPLKILIFDNENGDRRVKKRLKMLLNGLNSEFREENLYFLFDSNIKLDSQNTAKRKILEDIISYIKPDIIIIDSMARFFEGDENNSKDVRKIYDTIKAVGKIHKSAWLMLHHTRKTGTRTKHGVDIRGSGDFSAMADGVFMLNKATNNNEFIFSLAKSRDGQFFNPIKFQAVNSEDGLIIQDLGEVKLKQAITANEAAAEDIQEWFEKENIISFKTKQVKDCLNEHGNNAISDGLQLLCTKGILENKKRGFWKIKKYQEKLNS